MADLDKISLLLGEIKADMRSLKEDVVEMKEHIQDVRDFKTKVVAGAGIVSALASAAVTTLKSRFLDGGSL